MIHRVKHTQATTSDSQYDAFRFCFSEHSKIQQLVVILIINSYIPRIGLIRDIIVFIGGEYGSEFEIEFESILNPNILT